MVARETAAEGTTVIADPANRFEPFPLTEVQRAYWLGRSAAFALGRVATHLYWELEATDLDVPRLERAWNRLVARHDMLRVIVRPDGQQQVLAEVPHYTIATTAIGAGRTAVRDALEATRGEMSRQVFALETWPFFDIRVTPRGGGMARIHLSFDCIPIDGLSFSVMLSEWSRAYLDPDVALEPIGVSFRDCVLGAARAEDAAVVEAARAYWMARVDTMPAAPALPLARDPSTVDRPQFFRRELRLDAAAFARLKATAARTKVTLSALLLTLYCEVLARFSRDAQFTLNLTVLDRPPLHPDIDRLVGDFTSLMIFSAEAAHVDARASLEERAGAIQAQLWRDMQHRAYHGMNVIRELARRQPSARGITVPVIFTSVVAASGFDFAGLGKLGYGLTQTPQVWLDHQTFEAGNELVLVWDSVEELFPPGLLDHMFSYYERTIRAASGAAQAGAAAPGSVAVLSRAETERRRAANETWAAPATGLLTDTLARGLAHGAARPAVITAARTVSYGELDAESNRIGRLLRSQGAGPGKLIAVVMRKGWPQVVAVLGALKAGGAYLPVDADLPSERIRLLLGDGAVTQVLTTIDVAATWPDGVTAYAVDDPQVWQAVSADALEPAQAPQDLAHAKGTGSLAHPKGTGSPGSSLAYVIYTSGSTGKPKGVMIAHRAALNTIADVNQRLAMGPEDRILALSALSFDLSVYDLFGALACGGAIVMPPASAARDPGAWLELMRLHRVTVWNSVPALMELLVGVAGDGEPLGALRHVLLSGDWIPVALPDRVRRIAPAAAVTSLGGATEASIWSISYPIGPVSPAWKSIPYGRAMANQAMFVLDDGLEERPDWVPGELYIGGAGVALGYWQDAELTSEKFLTHPRTGQRLYRTGDWGRWLPDGTIEFLGRIDAQVKIHGHRIECGEIEAALAAHPRVRQCAVVVKRDPTNHPHLVAYVVFHDGQEAPSAQNVRAFLADKLPAYMVPAIVLALPSMPLTPNGKVDTRSLPTPDAFEDARPASRPPENATEGAILEIVARELGRAHIGIDDNFFEVGGDSIHALRILHAIGQRFETELSMIHFIEDPTIAGLALAVEEAILAELETSGEQ